MKIYCKGIVNGFFLDKYGKRGILTNNIPRLSVPIEIKEYPQNTESFALILKDYDSIIICGFPWIHWLVANLKEDKIGENASIKGNLLQGKTSYNIIGYGGMMPPDKDHIYDIDVYALDTVLNLKEGFTHEDLLEAMNNHIIDSANLKGRYKK